MFQKLHMPSVLLFGAIAAVAYAIPMTYFVQSANYADTWWLFLGNFFFLMVVAVYMLVFVHKKHDNPNSSLVLTAGHLVTVVGVIISCVLAFIVLMLYAPGVLGSGPSEKVLEGTPANAENGKTDGLVLFLFMDAIIGNITAGSAISIVLTYTAKRDQTKEKVISQVKATTR